MKQLDLVDIMFLSLFFVCFIGFWVRIALLTRIGNAIYALRDEIAKSNKRADEYFDYMPRFEDYRYGNFVKRDRDCKEDSD